jgi:endonuclease/exonuclease/phosphatase (EEP) superfamily protein YafD
MSETDRVTGAEDVRSPWWRRTALVLALLLLAGTAVVMLLRALGIEVDVLAYVVALTPWLLPVTVVALVLAGVARSRWTVVTAVALLAVQVWWLLPLVTAQTPQGDRRLVIASSNLRFGDASADDVLALVRDHQVDVLVVVELTFGAERRLEEAGVSTLLPYRFVEAGYGVQGTGVWSRYPLSDTGIEPGFFSRTLRATVSVGADRLTLVAAHPVAPGVSDNSVWRDEHALLLELIDGLTGDAVLVGDLNATRDNAVLRRYEEAGYLDAADQSGAGFVPTFPVGRGVPPAVGIDHVLVRAQAYVAESFDAVDITDTDHRAVVATYRFR